MIKQIVDVINMIIENVFGKNFLLGSLLWIFLFLILPEDEFSLSFKNQG